MSAEGRIGMFKTSYQLVLKQTRINEDLRVHGKDIEKAVQAILPTAKIKVEKEMYTIITCFEITRWKKICIGMEIAKIPHLRLLRIIKRDMDGKITSTRLFCRVKEKKPKLPLPKMPKQPKKAKNAKKA
jgi:hypothetical protein